MAFGLNLNNNQPYTRTVYYGPNREVQEGMQSLVANYNRAYGEAKAANEARYNQMLQIADQTTQQSAADIRSDYANQQASAMQQLARTGMANSTVKAPLSLAFSREKNAALSRNADQMQQTKLGIINSREDAYPDQASLVEVLSGLMGSYKVGGKENLLTALQGMRQS